MMLSTETPTMGHLIRPTVAKSPDKLAIIDLSVTPPKRVSYAELDRDLDAIAAGAQSGGVCQGDSVLIVLGNRYEFASAVYGLMRAGAVPCPVNPNLIPEEISQLMEDSGCVAIVAEEQTRDRVEKARAACTNVIGIAVDFHAEGWTNLAQLKSAGSGTPALPSVDNATIALQLYTSGSTGRPKGILLPHLQQLQHYRDLASYHNAIDPNPPTELVSIPLFHSFGIGMTTQTLIRGGSVVYMSRFRPRNFLQAISDHSVSHFTAVATMLIQLLQEADLLQTLDFSSLTNFHCGAAPSGAKILQQASEVLGAPVYYMYGTTECGGVFGHPPNDVISLESCGRVLPGVEVKLMDQDGKDADQGELWVSSPGIALGYRNLEKESADRFRGNWYKTGDILRRDGQGNYYFVGRVDDMFVCGGENIYPLEVEKVLCQHPGVQDVCVVPVEHAVKGQAPVAAIIKSEGTDIDHESIKSFYLERAPAYSHPRLVAFVDELPIAPTGKVDRQRVGKMMTDIAVISNLGD